MNSNQNDCLELKNIKYKTMLGNGASWPEMNANATNNLSNLDLFLENEKNNNNNEPWSKLDKTLKFKKLFTYAEIYKTEKNLDDKEYEQFLLFLKECLDRKKLQRVKDITYDKNTGIVKDIPGLFHNKVRNHFTIKNLDKRISTSKSLAPKKIKGTVKNTLSHDESSDTDNEG